MIDNVILVLFYYTSVNSDNVYYIQEYDAIIIADFDTEELFYSGCVLCWKNCIRYID